MKIGFWNRVVLIIRLMFFMNVSETLRLLFAQDIQPLNDENRENRAELRRNKDTIEKQSLKLHDYMSQTTEQIKRINILESQLESSDAESKEKISTMAKSLSEEATKAAAFEVKSQDLEAQLVSTKSLMVEKEQESKAILAEVNRKHTQALASEAEKWQGEITQERQTTEAILQDVLYELKGKGGDDNRYDDSKAGEFCKSLSPISCRSLKQIKKLQTRIEECELRINGHFADRDQADLLNNG
jgi:chromosome segregation ATPase